MEISSFPVIPPEDLTQFYSSPYPELHNSSPSHSPLKKLRTDIQTDFLDVDLNDYKESNPSAIKDFLSSLFTMEEEHIDTHQFLQFQNPQNSYYSNSNVSNEQLNKVEVVQPKQKNKRPRNSSPVPGDPSTAPVTHQRRLWVKDRSKDWWEKCSHPDFPEEEFKKSFKMSKATFNMICDELDPVITKKDTMLRAAIPVHQRVAVCIWRLATGEPLRLVSKRFGLGISTCHKLVLEVCSAIKTVMMPRFVQWPDEANLAEIKTKFESISGIPNVGGSIYTTHIPIIAPKVNVGAYFNKRHTERNQKTSYSITVQGVVDPNGIFTDVCIGWPGSMPDDKVMEQSALFQRATHGALNNVWMVGNSGYPLMDWMLVPYTHQNLTWTQHTFNEKIEEIQKVAKDSFYRLKKRWGCLQKRTEVKLQELPGVLGACCVLHNICEMRNEGIEPETDDSFELFDDEIVPENPVRSAAAVQARDHIAHSLLHHGHAGPSFF
ncbi:protein ANTAGONIST OF LIKE HETEROCHROMATIN PROTEIN 1-like [Amaranthus tricolor]|uniref:protein ANTAGONIST OF LIKE HETEROCHROMATIN PROTEIN 1-like n=1 Tax=Amaranthus tricolor TaxID=29722 RepID=UPI002582B509|nr:protein ANTAGONIST OF LIKE HETEROCHROMATIN PROTEIN 1-like [Amaranthus tricolor]